ncbi:uncharacterized protein ACMZJ9_021584 [Mantella aurantiaca]
MKDDQQNTEESEELITIKVEGEVSAPQFGLEDLPGLFDPNTSHFLKEDMQQLTAIEGEDVMDIKVGNEVPAPQTDMEELPECSAHRESHFIKEDVQQLIVSEMEMSNRCIKGEFDKQGEEIDTDVPLPCCTIISSDEESVVNFEASERTWVPDIVEAKSEGEAQLQKIEMSSRGISQRSGGIGCPIPPNGRVPWLQAPVVPRSAPQSSAVWPFFNICTVNRTVVICSLCLKRIKRGTAIGHLGTTCMKRHMTTHHTAQWEQYLNTSGRKRKGYTSPHTNGSRNRNPPERSPRPLCSTQEGLTIPHHYQGEDVMNIKIGGTFSAPQTGMELPECFEHSTIHFLKEDLQQLIGSEVMEVSDKSMKAYTKQREPTGTHVPATYCQVGSSNDKEIYDDEVSHRTWEPDIIEAQYQRGRKSSRGSLQRRGKSRRPRLPDAMDPWMQSTMMPRSTTQSSPVWAFFNTCTIDRTVVICNLCLKRMKRGNIIGHLGTTCMKRHMVTYHTAQWEQHLEATGR